MTAFADRLHGHADDAEAHDDGPGAAMIRGLAWAALLPDLRVLADGCQRGIDRLAPLVPDGSLYDQIGWVEMIETLAAVRDRARQQWLRDTLDALRRGEVPAGYPTGGTT